MTEIFESAICAVGGLCGVFEYDGEVGYFYLCRLSDDGESKILDAIRVVSGTVDFTQADVRVEWAKSNKKLGLFIKGVLWAIFDTTSGKKHGGNYSVEKAPSLSPEAFL
jgi:hypothetical protein